MCADTEGDLELLIQWGSPLEGLIAAANQCDRYDGALVDFDRSDVSSILRRCIAGELDVHQLPRWAQAVHMLESLEIADGELDLLTQFLFEVSSPELFEPVTVEVCRRWLDRMGPA
ncbi:hypothetical protein ACFVIM_12885 [Streptomyces sp. NPDC057638]|uniref:hypothetical protein n=1 Tax=Streptomyces sp. NPDC057638 TaxID=3346190 RepID=UPI00367F2BAF